MTGTLASALGGALFAVQGWLTGGAVGALSIDTDRDEMRSQTDRWALWFLIVAIIGLTIFFTAGIALEWAGAEIRARLTKESVRAILRQDITFFESST